VFSLTRACGPGLSFEILQAKARNERGGVKRKGVLREKRIPRKQLLSVERHACRPGSGRKQKRRASERGSKKGIITFIQKEGSSLVTKSINREETERVVHNLNLKQGGNAP